MLGSLRFFFGPLAAVPGGLCLETRSSLDLCISRLASKNGARSFLFGSFKGILAPVRLSTMYSFTT